MTRCRLDEEQLLRLAETLEAGPAVHGWVEDQRWRPPRVAALIATLFRVRYTQPGVSLLLHPMGWSPQVPGAPRGRAGSGGGVHLGEGVVAGGKATAAAVVVLSN